MTKTKVIFQNFINAMELYIFSVTMFFIGLEKKLTLLHGKDQQIDSIILSNCVYFGVRLHPRIMFRL